MTSSTQKLAARDSAFIHEDNIVSVHWKDRRDVFLISSIHNVLMCKREMMKIFQSQHMGSADKCDQYLSHYSLGRKSIIWWKKVFFRLFELCIINAMVVYFNKNIEFSKRRQAHKLFHEILGHELVQLLLDKHSNGDIDVVGPARRSVSNHVRLKGKRFSVSKHPMRKICVTFAYQKTADGKQKKTKTSNFCEKCSVFVCKTCFALWHNISDV